MTMIDWRGKKGGWAQKTSSVVRDSGALFSGQSGNSLTAEEVKAFRDSQGQVGSRIFSQGPAVAVSNPIGNYSSQGKAVEELPGAITPSYSNPLQPQPTNPEQTENTPFSITRGSKVVARAMFTEVSRAEQRLVSDSDWDVVIDVLPFMAPVNYLLPSVVIKEPQNTTTAVVFCGSGNMAGNGNPHITAVYVSMYSSLVGTNANQRQEVHLFLANLMPYDVTVIWNITRLAALT